MDLAGVGIIGDGTVGDGIVGDGIAGDGIIGLGILIGVRIHTIMASLEMDIMLITIDIIDTEKEEHIVPTEDTALPQQEEQALHLVGEVPLFTEIVVILEG